MRSQAECGGAVSRRQSHVRALLKNWRSQARRKREELQVIDTEKRKWDSGTIVEIVSTVRGWAKRTRHRLIA